MPACGRVSWRPLTCSSASGPAVPLFAAVARHARGILERDADALVAAASALHSSARPLLYAALPRMPAAS